MYERETMFAMGGTECTLGIGEWSRYLTNAGVSFITYTDLSRLMWLCIPRSISIGVQMIYLYEERNLPKPFQSKPIRDNTPIDNAMTAQPNSFISPAK